MEGVYDNDRYFIYNDERELGKHEECVIYFSFSINPKAPQRNLGFIWKMVPES